MQRSVMTKSAKYSKIPSKSDLDAFTGMHCAALYKMALACGWRCPSCGRNAHELVRWTENRGPAWRARFGDAYGMGFTITLTNHQCHGKGRFPRTLICGDCNSADGAAKRRLGLPGWWSFAPEEIGRFVEVEPYSGETRINYDKARLIFEAAQSPFFGETS